MTSLEDDSHASLAQPPLELIAAIQDGVPGDGRCQCITVRGTVIKVIREAMSTSRTFFHLLAWSRSGWPSYVQVRKASTGGAGLSTRKLCAGMYADTSHSSIRRLSSQQLGHARLARSMKSKKIIATRPRAGKKSNSE